MNIGCDIIHLQDHWSVNTLRQRRLSKLYNKGELILLSQIHKTPKIAEAVLWSAKESAYKSAYLGEAIFIPKKFILKQVLKESLEFQFDKTPIWISYKIEKEYVFTETFEMTNSVKEKGDSFNYVHIEKSTGNESYEVRKRVYQYLKNRYGGEWGIRKTEFGKPYLTYNNKMSEKKISISHHKPFIAFVLR